LHILGTCLLRHDFRFQLVNHVLSLQVPNLDEGSRRSAEPVAIGGEAKGVDDVRVVEGVEMLLIMQIPQHSLRVFSSRRAKGPVRGHSHGVQVSSVLIVARLQLAVGQVPHLDRLVPSTRDDDRLGNVG